MGSRMVFVFGIAIGGSVLLTLLSVYPGLLPDLSFIALLFSPFWLPATCVGGVVYLDLFNRIPDLTKPPFFRRAWVRLATTALILNLILLASGTPRRVAFLFSRNAFIPFVSEARDPGLGAGETDHRLGLYRVSLIAADPRGGVYFKTHGGADGFSTRTRTYGIAYRPNPFGSPFGDGNYTVSPLVGDWSSFAASDRD